MFAGCSFKHCKNQSAITQVNNAQRCAMLISCCNELNSVTKPLIKSIDIANSWCRR